MILIFLHYSWFTVFCQFYTVQQVTHLHIHVYILYLHIIRNKRKSFNRSTIEWWYLFLLITKLIDRVGVLMTKINKSLYNLPLIILIMIVFSLIHFHIFITFKNISMSKLTKDPKI